MPLVDRLPATVWPDEPNVGGRHLTVRYLSIPVLLTIGVGALAGLLPGLSGTAALGVAAGAVGVAGLSVLEVRTRKCFGYALLGIDTCPVDVSDGPAAPTARDEEAL